jgi:hypothetical protein
MEISDDVDNPNGGGLTLVPLVGNELSDGGLKDADVPAYRLARLALAGSDDLTR